MKTKLPFSALLFLLAFFPELGLSQSAGTTPMLSMTRYNSSPTVSPLPVVQGNLLGTLKWNGLVAYGDIRTGASIQSYITGPVSTGFLYANLVFRTGAPDQQNRMVITQDGLVGIGTMNPQFHLHTIGNTHTTGNFFGRIHFDTNSATDDAPNTYTNEAYFERKLRSVLTVSTVAGANDFGGILSLAPGGGAYDHQLFFGQEGIWNRREQANNPSWSAPWEKLLSSADIQGRKNLVSRFMPPDNLSSKLGESQLYDDGSNVVVGGIPAGPGPATPVFDPANLFTVNGATRINGKTFTNGRLGIFNDTPAEALDVTGNAVVSGSTTTNSLTVDAHAKANSLDVTTSATTNSLTVAAHAKANSLDVTTLASANSLTVTTSTITGTLAVTENTGVAFKVAGWSEFENPVRIGAGSVYAPGFALSVEGGIITNAVRVKVQPWPDYVFEEGYPLLPLAEVEKYVQENKHLPGVVPAGEVAANGLDLGQIQKVQMEKTEELFLYLLQQQKQIELQQKTIERLESEIKKLQK